MRTFKLNSGERVELPAGTFNPLKQTKRGTQVVRSDFQSWEIAGRYAGRDVMILQNPSTGHSIEGQLMLEVEFVGPDKNGDYRFKNERLGAVLLGKHARLAEITHVPTDPEGIFPNGIFFAEPLGDYSKYLGFPRNANAEERNAMMGLYKKAAEKFGKTPIALGPDGEISLSRMSLDYANIWRGPDDVLSSEDVDGLSLA